MKGNKSATSGGIGVTRVFPKLSITSSVLPYAQVKANGGVAETDRCICWVLNDE